MRVKTNESIRSPYRPVCDLLASRFGNNRWIVFSLRLRRLVILFSDLELDHWVLIESNSKIVSYCEQPLRKRAKIAGTVVTSVPDMWVLFESGLEQFREVKFRSQLTEPRVVRQVQTQKTWCGIESKPHDVFDEYRIRRNPRYIRSWKFILRVLATSHNTNLHPICQKVSHLLYDGHMKVGQLEAQCSSAERSLLRPAVFKMLHAGQAKAPLGSHEITNDLPVELRR